MKEALQAPNATCIHADSCVYVLHFYMCKDVLCYYHIAMLGNIMQQQVKGAVAEPQAGILGKYMSSMLC